MAEQTLKGEYDLGFLPSSEQLQAKLQKVLAPSKKKSRS